MKTIFTTLLLQKTLIRTRKNEGTAKRSFPNFWCQCFEVDFISTIENDDDEDDVTSANNEI